MASFDAAEKRTLEKMICMRCNAQLQASQPVPKVRLQKLRPKAKGSPRIIDRDGSQYRSVFFRSCLPVTTPSEPRTVRNGCYSSGYFGSRFSARSSAVVTTSRTSP